MWLRSIADRASAVSHQGQHCWQQENKCPVLEGGSEWCTIVMHHVYLHRRETHSVEGHPEEGALGIDRAQCGRESLECRNSGAASLGNEATAIGMKQPS